MRILVAAERWFPDRRGGFARVVTDTARYLSERGHEVTVLVPHHEGAPRHESGAGLDVWRILPRTFLPPAATDVASTAVLARRLAGPWTTAIAHSAMTGTGLLLARLGIPVARVYHASAVRELLFVRPRLRTRADRLSSYGLHPLLSATDTLSLRAASRILTLSDFSRDLIAADHPWALPRTITVGGGVDTDVFSPGEGQMAARERLGIAADARLVLTVRRLDHRMGLDLLIRAIAIDPLRDALLAVVGIGELESQLRSLAMTIGVANRVRFLGSVTDDELVHWYRAADMFVLPTVAYEGFGMATAEALACGTPVIGTPVGATPELLRPLDQRFVTDEPSAEALAKAMGTLLPESGARLRAACRQYALRQLAWSKTIRRWEAALEETMLSAKVRK